jgi:Protein of unknown function (DUF2840)
METDSRDEANSGIADDETCIAHPSPGLSLTEVHLDNRSNRRYRLLFGAPFDVVAKDQPHPVSARIAYFRPGDRFGLALWESNDFGTTLWRVLVCRTLQFGETGIRVPRVLPGARILLDVTGATRAKAALRWLSHYTEPGEATSLSDEMYIAAGFRLANTPLARLKSYAAGRT